MPVAAEMARLDIAFDRRPRCKSTHLSRLVKPPYSARLKPRDERWPTEAATPSKRITRVLRHVKPGTQACSGNIMAPATDSAYHAPPLPRGYVPQFAGSRIQMQVHRGGGAVERRGDTFEVRPLAEYCRHSRSRRVNGMWWQRRSCGSSNSCARAWKACASSKKGNNCDSARRSASAATASIAALKVANAPPGRCSGTVTPVPMPLSHK